MALSSGSHSQAREAPSLGGCWCSRKGSGSRETLPGPKASHSFCESVPAERTACETPLASQGAGGRGRLRGRLAILPGGAAVGLCMLAPLPQRPGLLPGRQGLSSDPPVQPSLTSPLPSQDHRGPPCGSWGPAGEGVSPDEDPPTCSGSVRLGVGSREQGPARIRTRVRGRGQGGFRTDVFWGNKPVFIYSP